MATQRKTPRQVAREQTVARIKELALEQLRTAGADALSLRAIARELGVVSSAVYRYFASREELLTALILDAYRDLAVALEATPLPKQAPSAASGQGGEPLVALARDGWLARCRTLRAWALQQPHRFGLIYGSAIPGYRAPADTIEPAARVVAALGQPVFAAGITLAWPDRCAPMPSPALDDSWRALAGALGAGARPDLMPWIAENFALLIGFLTLELNGHFVGVFTSSEEFFETTALRSASALGPAAGHGTG